jgi:hypothetical protein
MPTGDLTVTTLTAEIPSLSHLLGWATRPSTPPDDPAPLTGRREQLAHTQPCR